MEVDDATLQATSPSSSSKHAPEVIVIDDDSSDDSESVELEPPPGSPTARPPRPTLNISAAAAVAAAATNGVQDEPSSAEKPTDVEVALLPTPSPTNDAPQTIQIPSAPAAAVTASGAGAEQATGDQKKKHKGAKEDSPAPQLPPVPPPQPTIRLEFFVSHPEQYEFDILAMAKSTGQRLPTPTLEYKDSSDSESDDDGPEQPDAPPAPDVPLPPVKRRRKRHHAEYDLEDPFIDDDDLAMDVRTHIAQTAQQGFYVSSGDVDLVEDMTAPPLTLPKRGPGRPPARAPGPISAALLAQAILAIPLGDVQDIVAKAQHDAANTLAMGSAIQAGGTKDSPILLPDEADGAPQANGNDRKRKLDPKDTADPKKKRKTTDIQPFSPDLEAEFDVLRAAINAHSFEQKGKFPPDLKPRLCEVAKKAISTNEYDDNFFNYLPKIFPYNRFTMLKLTKRLVYNDHVRMIQDRQDQLLQEMGHVVKEGMDMAQMDWERSLAVFEDRKTKKRLTTDPKTGDPSAHDGSEEKEKDYGNSAAPTVVADGDKGDQDGEDGDEAADKDKPPPKKYKLNEVLRAILWALVTLNNNVCELTNEKNTLENSKELVSDQSQRKALYQKIMPLFPEGWMNTGVISREVSAMKKKFEALHPPPKPEGGATEG